MTPEKWKAREQAMAARQAQRQAELEQRQAFYARVQEGRAQFECGATFAPPGRLASYYAEKRPEEAAQARQLRKESNQRGAAWAAQMPQTPARQMEWQRQYFSRMNDEVE